MPKANSIHNTIASGLNRRGVLVGGAMAMAAAATLPSLAGGSQYSPEFLEWYALAKTTPEVICSVDPGEQIARLWHAMTRLEDVIFARPIRSQSDVDELAIIALYWSDPAGGPKEDANAISEFALGCDPGVESECRHERSWTHLVQAAARLAMQRFDGGGANV